MDVDGLRWEVRTRGSGRPLLLVHGFTGRGTSWGAHTAAFAAVFRVIVVDLPGHGRTAATPNDPSRMSVERTADDLATILRRLDASPASVLGYSLGARVALRLAVAHPESVARLVLESPSAGIENPSDRDARRAADEALAGRIERDGIAAFVAEWEAQPIFATQAHLPAARAAQIHRTRLANRPQGLAASLRGAGQARMEPLHERLGDVSAPTLVIAGAVDDRGRPRAEAVATTIPGARLEIVDGSGHTPHDERPIAFRRLALDFLQEDAA
ncbi:MAG TPA: 2-succinyl-6-hydroxy-2,4-cyclohexadiene-1-carboxylate synthase [Candidatus Limnocylindrales bacterium]|jgi:2-succinyl-6-hydroxy-2,4-cyclohexadiene-1-carboxylate synthase